MKIMVMFTGGTIGSLIGDDGYISTSKDARYMLIDQYEKRASHMVEFCTTEPYTILSENLKGSHLIELINAVKEQLLNEELAGIIVTHGTDTLQYSAAILQWVFGDCNIPIVLVSSDFVLTDKRANGPDNFAAAVEFIKGGYGKGVFVSYKNTGQAPTIHRGTKLQNPISYSADVNSIMGNWFGKFEGEAYVANEGYVVDEFEGKSLFGDNKENIVLANNANFILRINPYPGMIYPDLSEMKEVKVVLHESYHSGTICIDKGLQAFTKQANELNIPIYLTGLNGNEAEYETVQMYRDLGITTLPNCATIALYCKLWLELSNA